MGKLPQISKALKSNVILLKEEGYKNIDISKRLKLSEASVSRILQRNKENLSLSPLKRSRRPRTTTLRTDRNFIKAVSVRVVLMNMSIECEIRTTCSDLTLN